MTGQSSVRDRWQVSEERYQSCFLTSTYSQVHLHMRMHTHFKNTCGLCPFTFPKMQMVNDTCFQHYHPIPPAAAQDGPSSHCVHPLLVAVMKSCRELLYKGWVSSAESGGQGGMLGVSLRPAWETE